jgi:hypothetical protein
MNPRRVCSKRGLQASAVDVCLVALFWLLHGPGLPAARADDPEARRPGSETELRSWLQNMIWYHHFTLAEVAAATGLEEKEIAQAQARFMISPENKPNRKEGAPLFVLPYPGGRHPRIGFLDGAVRPQRDTKFSVFTPWDQGSYVVVDLPEAIWSNLGLTYLAHTHVPTIWTQKGIALERTEWHVDPNGRLASRRALPNGIAFAARVVPRREAVFMELRLTNGTNAPLTKLRVQQCVMLKGAQGFARQTDENKVFRAPYAACRGDDGRRWIIVAWERCQRVWGNPPCPCLHSDPVFPDCAPGQEQIVRGRLSFYEGDDIEAEFERIDRTGWRTRLME